MKKLLLILLLCPMLVYSQKNITYQDIDLFLLKQEELVKMFQQDKQNVCYTNTKANAKSNHYGFLTIGKRLVDEKSYNIDIYYNEKGLVRRLDINNPPYNPIGIWNICLFDSNQLCYLYYRYTYRVYVTKNSITFILHD